MNNQQLIDNITLEYLLNPSLYDKIMSKKESSEELICKDILFYRKRIAKLTKDMGKGIYINDSLKTIFIGYATTLIYYLKQLDEKDIIQEEYNCNDNTIEDNDIGNTDVSNNDADNNNLNNINKLDNILINNQQQTYNLNNFVKKIKIVKEPKILPQQKKINIQDPKFKKKGLHKI